MVRLLELENRKPSSVILLDGSQSYVSGIIDGYKSRLNTTSTLSSTTGSGRHLEDQEAQEQVETLIVFVMQFCPVEAISLKKTLLGLKSWKERVDYVAGLVTDKRKAVGVVSSQNEHHQVWKVFIYTILYKTISLTLSQWCVELKIKIICTYTVFLFHFVWWYEGLGWCIKLHILLTGGDGSGTSLQASHCWKCTQVGGRD